MEIYLKENILIVGTLEGFINSGLTISKYL